MAIANIATLQGVNDPEAPPCIVLNCGREAQHLWISPTWQGWPAEWLVCDEHYEKFVADQEWQRVHGLAALLHAVTSPPHDISEHRT